MRGHAAAVRQPQVHDGTIRVEFLAEAVGDHLKAGLQRALFKSNSGQRLDLAVLLNPDGRIGIDHDFGDGFGFKQMLDRFQERQMISKLIAAILSGIEIDSSPGRTKSCDGQEVELQIAVGRQAEG